MLPSDVGTQQSLTMTGDASDADGELVAGASLPWSAADVVQPTSAAAVAAATVSRRVRTH